MKKILLLFTLIIPFFCTSSANKLNVTEAVNINLIINSEKIVLSSPILISNSHILFPLRELCNKLSVPSENITWEKGTQSITVFHNNKNLKMKLGSNIAKINEIEIILPCIPILYKDQTYIPLRMLSEFLDCFIIWDDTAKTAFIKNFDDYFETKNFLTDVNNNISKIYDVQIDIINEVANTSFGNSIYINSQKNIVLEKNILSGNWKETDIKLTNSLSLEEINYISTLACGMKLDEKLSSENFYVYTGYFPALSGRLTKAKLYIDTNTLYLSKLVSETPTEIGLLKQNVLFNVGKSLI